MHVRLREWDCAAPRQHRLVLTQQRRGTAMSNTVTRRHQRTLGAVGVPIPTTQLLPFPRRVLPRAGALFFEATRVATRNAFSHFNGPLSIQLPEECLPSLQPDTAFVPHPEPVPAPRPRGILVRHIAPSGSSAPAPQRMPFRQAQIGSVSYFLSTDLFMQSTLGTYVTSSSVSRGDPKSAW